MLGKSSLTDLLPMRMRNAVDPYIEALEMLLHIGDVGVLKSLGPSGVRGLLLHQGRRSPTKNIPAAHPANFDWTYPADNADMSSLYARAKKGQWNSEDLPWDTDVDLADPNSSPLPRRLVNLDKLEEVLGVKLTEKERDEYMRSMTSWMISQFLHGEQGALFASAQVTQAIHLFDGKLYGASQVMDEARHVEVFRRYLNQKLQKMYPVNDQLYTILDSLMGDRRWDLKFLGMQIMIEGLALGAFGYLHEHTQEPLLRQLLRSVIQDEARHVHYGVVAVREHIANLSDSERRERETWCFEVALLMRNRFVAYEVYDEHFSGVLPREKFREYALQTPLLNEFTQLMFKRLMPNLRDIGLLSPRIAAKYEREGLMRFATGRSATQLNAEQLLSRSAARPAEPSVARA